MNKKFNVTFYTRGGKVINTIMEMPSVHSIIAFVDENDYVIVDVDVGATNTIIPKGSIDYFTVNA